MRVTSNKAATVPRQMVTVHLFRAENCERKPRTAVSTPKTSWMYGAIKSAGGDISLDGMMDGMLVGVDFRGHSPGNMNTAAAVHPLLNRACRPIDWAAAKTTLCIAIPKDKTRGNTSTVWMKNRPDGL